MRPANFYASPGFERAGLHRKDARWIREALTRAGTVFVPVWRSQSLVAELGDAEPRAMLLDLAGLADHLGPSLEALDERLGKGEVVLLGVIEDRAHFAIDLSSVEAPLSLLDEPALAASGIAAGSLRFADLRQVGPRLDRGEGALLAFARGMMFWHSRHRFCGVCGAPTRCEEGGHVRRCTDSACRSLHFPRTDPAVIMLVVDGERALMGRQKAFLPGMYSTLAGFVEPGESLEDAVAREVMEETGVAIGPAYYHSSQPWPFPGSIMLGFHAEARSTEITIDPGEIEEARWFERDWLLAHADDGSFRLPRPDSIARRLVEDWLHGRVDFSPARAG